MSKSVKIEVVRAVRIDGKLYDKPRWAAERYAKELYGRLMRQRSLKGYRLATHRTYAHYKDFMRRCVRRLTPYFQKLLS